MRKSSVIKVELLTLQATNHCNLRCTYCYLDRKESRSLMTMETIRKTMTRLRDEDLLGPELRISWQLGEPLLAGISFYEQAFALTQEILGNTTRVVQHIQTNATLISQRGADFLSRHHVQVGVSLDGPQQLHDAHRRYPDGTGTHAEILKGINRLRQSGIQPAVICVISRRSLDFANEMHDFFHQLGLHMVSFNAEEIEGVHYSTSLLDGEGWRDRYKRFLTTFFLRARKCESRVAIREFANVADWLRLKRPRASGPALPFHHVTVNTEGGFATFSPELTGVHHPDYGSFVLGNVHDDTIYSIMTSKKYSDLWSEIREGLLRCKEECSLFPACGGGSPSNKLLENGSFASTKTVACELGIQVPFEVVSQLDEIHSSTNPEPDLRDRLV